MSALKYLEGYTPSDLDLDGYASFRTDALGREVQLEVVEFAAYCEKRVAACMAPTGIGKSLVALALAKLTGMRTCILTSTKGLQEQYVRDSERYGLVDIRGRSNYECGDYSGEGLDCRDGAVLGCRYANGNGCGYERSRAVAKEAGIVSANYAYWMTSNDKGVGIERTGKAVELAGENPFELLILDEGHLAPDLLADYLSVKFYEGDIKAWCDPKLMGDGIEQWQNLIKNVGVVEALKEEMKSAALGLAVLGRKAKREDVGKLRKLESLLQKFERVAGMKEDWVCEKREGTRYGRVWGFDVIWPGRYAEQYLFCNVPKVVVMSATLRPKTLGLLGVKTSDFEFREWPRIFPANRHPLYNFPAKDEEGKEIRMKYGMPAHQLSAWVEHIDSIIDLRLDRKGLIQTVSYDRQKYLMEHSRHAGLMIGNTSDPESETALQVAESFRDSPAPKILVSPSFATGWDFPGDQCEFTIVCKLPFKPGHGKVAKAREERDPQYGFYLTMVDLVQSAGRGMRSAEDRCEVFVTDGMLNWFLFQNKNLAPDWFVKGMRKVVEMPKPAPKL